MDTPAGQAPVPPAPAAAGGAAGADAPNPSAPRPSGLTIRPIKSTDPQGSNTPVEAQPAEQQVSLTPGQQPAAKDQPAAAPQKFTFAGREFNSLAEAEAAYRGAVERQAAVDRRAREIEERERQQQNPETQQAWNAAARAVGAMLRAGQTPEQVSQAVGYDVRATFPQLVAAARPAPVWNEADPWTLTPQEMQGLAYSPQDLETIRQAMIEDPTGIKATQIQANIHADRFSKLASATAARQRHLADSVAPLLRERAAREAAERRDRAEGDYYVQHLPNASNWARGLKNDDGTPMFPTLAKSVDACKEAFAFFAEQGYDPRNQNHVFSFCTSFESPAWRKAMGIEWADEGQAPGEQVAQVPAGGRTTGAVDLTMDGQGGLPGSGTAPAAARPAQTPFGGERRGPENHPVLGHPVNALWRTA